MRQNASAYDFNQTERGFTISKEARGVGNFNDALYIHLNQVVTSTTPKHLHAVIKTNQRELQSCNMRLSLTSNTENTLGNNDTTKLYRTGYPGPTSEKMDSLLFRLGHYKYLNVNMDDMLVAFLPHVEYTVDMVFDWDMQTTAVLINNTLTSTVNFFSKPPGNEEQQFYHHINGTDVLYLYNLSPGTRCDFTDLQVCDDICPGTNETISFREVAAALLSLATTFALLVLY